MPFGCLVNDMSNIVKLIIALIIPLAVGGISGFFTASSVDNWYQTVNKPSWNPPNWVFGPVWITLYVLMGIALYLVWKSGADESVKKTAIILFAVQLGLNFFWSFIFFNQHQIGWALAEIIAMWIMILLTIFAFARANNTAAWLLVPYISWVSFATILNYTIWKLN
jgi:translocator protein